MGRSGFRCLRRFSIANYKTMIASARRRAILLSADGEPSPAVPRISDLAHFHGSAIGKLELDMMGTHQMTESQVLDAILAKAIAAVFEEYVDAHGLGEIAEIFAQGVRVEVGDTLPVPTTWNCSLVPPAWTRRSNNAADIRPFAQAASSSFWRSLVDRSISRGERHGRLEYVIDSTTSRTRWHHPQLPRIRSGEVPTLTRRHRTPS